MIEGFDGFDVSPASEAFLLEAMRKGAAGCISATANVNPAAIHGLHAHWQDADAEARQAELTRFPRVIEGFLMIPALKAIVRNSRTRRDGTACGRRSWSWTLRSANVCP